MTQAGFDECFEFTLKYEGGYVNNHADPGGPTNLGVTQATLSAVRGRKASIADVKALTPAAVKPIYEKEYWNRVRGGRLPVGVDLVVYDFAVNSGPHKAAMTLQDVVGAAADGIIGNITIGCCVSMGAIAVIDGVCDARLAFLRKLSTWPKFGKGWERRVEAVRKQAKLMATVAPEGDKEILSSPRTDRDYDGTPAVENKEVKMDGLNSILASMAGPGSALFRHAISVVVGALATKLALDGGTSEAIVTAIVGLANVAWSMATSKKSVQAERLSK